MHRACDYQIFRKLNSEFFREIVGQKEFQKSVRSAAPLAVILFLKYPGSVRNIMEETFRFKRDRYIRNQ